MERVLSQQDDFASWQEKVRGTNISTASLLATDYLNHFNEIIMLLGMVPDMPEILEECREWRPKDYKAHFRDSGFSDKELAIAAYDHVPVRFKTPFEDIIDQMNKLVDGAIEKLDSIQAANDAEALAFKAGTASRLLQHLLDCASAVIHGSEMTMSQRDIDSFLGA